MKQEELAQKLGIELEVLKKLRALERVERAHLQREGIARAKAVGVQFGRPRLPVKELETVCRLYAKGEITQGMAAAIAGVSRSTINRRIHEFLAETNTSHEEETN